MHARTAFEDSTTFYTSVSKTFQGVVQGDGEAPALWLIISIFLIRYLYYQTFVTAITSSISKLITFLASFLDVDDTNIYVLNSGFENTHKIVVKSQSLMNSWHKELKFTGCELKLDKCYLTLQAYS